MTMKNITLLAIILLCFSSVFAQNSNSNPEAYKFSPIIRLAATPVKNQAVTGTCWSFATTSFLESELLRMGKGEYDLSEMYTVRNNYIDRMNDNFIRDGKGNLGEGSLSHMLLKVVKQHGMVPDAVYSGINYNSKTHDHTELNGFINAIAVVPVANKNKSPEYEKLLNSLLDIYLGPVPSKFDYKGKNYTPQSFFNSLGINLNDYVEITSFSHHPYYTKFVLEIPDNWDSGSFYNLPLDEFMQVVNYSLSNGYTLCWDGDMSEKSYSDRMGVAVNATSEELENEKGKELSFTKRYDENEVTQESRQKGFESKVTTDDHLMHLIGLSKDEAGTPYYIVKNSWKPEINRFGGYNYLSENYVKAKTIMILVHKSAIPKAISDKLGL